MNEAPETNVLEIVMGAILLGLGLLYLMSQYSAEMKLIHIAMSNELETTDVYQQVNDTDSNFVSGSELLTVLIGYRDYPVVVDGKTVNPEDVNYEEYISLVKDGYYSKSYEYNTSHEICKVIYTHSVAVKK